MRIIAGEALTFERLVGTAYDQIRQSASDHVSVYLHVLTALAQIIFFVRTPDRLEPLINEGRLTYEAARASVPNPTDLAVIRGKYAELRSAAKSSRERFNS